MATNECAKESGSVSMCRVCTMYNNLSDNPAVGYARVEVTSLSLVGLLDNIMQGPITLRMGCD